jgi:hypothetical protein
MGYRYCCYADKKCVKEIIRVKILSMKIKVLKAEYGDSILIEFRGNDKQNHHILIDGGTPRTYNAILKDNIMEIISQKEFIDRSYALHEKSHK